ncbi:cyclic nucleotide-binding domain-containing protein [Pseudorhodoferax sp.]|uniref:cyclic nucleotide-binding domain-containing protein n=1 Tax=Pseudorhodoferax sp. TaxID=1993553 RepID=UPI0039E66384
MTDTPPSAGFDLQDLIDAIAQATAEDRLPLQLSPAQWQSLAPYLRPLALADGQVLFKQGAADRTLYLIERGSLGVHLRDTQGELRLAVLGAGSAVGEGSFFARAPRSATVQASEPARLWGLSPRRFAALSEQQPALALAVAMAAGAVVTYRMVNRRRFDAVT